MLLLKLYRLIIEPTIMSVFFGAITALTFRENYWMFGKIPLPKVSKRNIYLAGLVILTLTIIGTLASATPPWVRNRWPSNPDRS